MNDVELDQLLKECGTALQVPAGFQRDVWSRVEAAELGGWKVRPRQLLERFFGLLARPAVAVATCGVMVVAGAWFGMVSSAGHPSNEVAYMRSVNPLAQSHR